MNKFLAEFEKKNLNLIEVLLLPDYVDFGSSNFAAEQILSCNIDKKFSVFH